jgi:hypothetical protein
MPTVLTVQRACQWALHDLLKPWLTLLPELWTAWTPTIQPRQSDHVGSAKVMNRHEPDLRFPLPIENGMSGAVLRTGNLQNEADLNRGLREAQIHVPRRRPDAAMVEDR